MLPAPEFQVPCFQVLSKVCVCWRRDSALKRQVSFGLTLTYVSPRSLNEIDRCLEDPFLHPPHDFELAAIQRSEFPLEPPRRLVHVTREGRAERYSERTLVAIAYIYASLVFVP